ncbi:hypothetical protein DLEV_159 [Diachasmimorpha longicaudata entomopoxvirus]|uniref:Uncharacterized protein n=1 Tax=Diachasmimorpha longicaudata entomopoxvirus TaxID=109981 RepID=A0A7R5WGA6_9POXV|nr:hypothetical protein QKK69_gp159 [Diachasmimorpha longicaudata entomopoxvirus]AKS26450.1 hypothetical protein DLEV_159 [Diachasmimorpha longicaudata entomopoxvirus]
MSNMFKLLDVDEDHPADKIQIKKILDSNTSNTQNTRDPSWIYEVHRDSSKAHTLDIPTSSELSDEKMYTNDYNSRGSIKTEPYEKHEFEKIYPELPHPMPYGHVTENLEAYHKNCKILLLLYNNSFLNPIKKRSEELFKDTTIVEKLFVDDNFRPDIDTMLYDKTPVKWPSYVKQIYYTRETHDGKIRQVSVPVNLFLNKANNARKLVTLQSVGYVNTLLLFLKYGQITQEDFRREFFTKTFFQQPARFVHDFFYDPLLVSLQSTRIDSPLLSTERYKDFFDYIPTCYIPSKRYSYKFRDTEEIMVSDFCFHHSSGCHYQCRHNTLDGYHHEEDRMPPVKFTIIPIQDLREEAKNAVKP